MFTGFCSQVRCCQILQLSVDSVWVGEPMGTPCVKFLQHTSIALCAFHPDSWLLHYEIAISFSCFCLCLYFLFLFIFVYVFAFVLYLPAMLTSPLWDCETLVPNNVTPAASFLLHSHTPCLAQTKGLFRKTFRTEFLDSLVNLLDQSGLWKKGWYIEHCANLKNLTIQSMIIKCK